MKTALWIVAGLVVLGLLYWWVSARSLPARPAYSSGGTGGTGLLESITNASNQVKRLADSIFGKPAPVGNGAMTAAPNEFTDWAM